MAEPISAAATWVAMTVFQAASAAGLSISAAATVANIALAATTVAANVALAAATNAILAPKPKVNASGSPVQFKPDPEPSIPFPMGRMAYAGTPVAAFVGGDKNKYLSFFTVLGLGPTQAIEDFKAGDQSVVFSERGGEEAAGYYLNRMWQIRRLGLPDQTAMVHTATGSKDTPADHNGNVPEWTSAHRLRGLAATLWTMEYDAGKYQGVPQPLYVLQGMKLWDPRFDSTYPGGSGSQRRDDWTTWAYTANPYVHALAWARGHFARLAGGGFGVRLGGIGAPDAQIDIAAFVEGANIADANDWTIGGVVTTADDKWNAFAAMLQAGGGVPLHTAARISCLVKTPKVAVLDLLEEDLAGEVVVDASLPRRDRFNRIAPKYRSELHRWETVTGTVITSSTYLTEDRNEPRTREIEYPYVAGGDEAAQQAGQLAAYDLCDSREGVSAVIPCKPYLLGVRPGDAITVTVHEGGLQAQKVLVTKRDFDPQTGVVTLSVRSETDAKHDFALGRTDTAPPSPTLTANDPSVTPLPDSGQWTATGTTFTAGGASIPAIVVAGAGRRDPDRDHGPDA